MENSHTRSRNKYFKVTEPEKSVVINLLRQTHKSVYGKSTLFRVDTLDNT